MNELSQIEPIPLPDVNKLDTIPAFPAWLRTRVAAVSRANDAQVTGRYCNGPWMPLELIPSPAQRAAIERHADALKELADQTPEHNEESEKATGVLIAKLLQALSSQRTTQAAITARAEALMIAVESDPHWAVAAAIRGWYRGQYGKEHDYRRPPAPAVLHELAMREAWKIRGRIRQLEDVLNAETSLPLTDEHRGRMLMRLAKETPMLLGTASGLKAKITETV
jgi:hypothetical protein